MKESRQRIIVALDVDAHEAGQIIKEVGPYVGLIKVGKEMMTEGTANDVMFRAVQQGMGTFYDGKYFDIPETVYRASLKAARLVGVRMFNVHCLGGLEMMQAARRAVDEVASQAMTAAPRPLILGVTLLTSMDVATCVGTGLLPVWAETDDVEIKTKFMRDAVRKLALLAKKAGLDGVIASPLEIAEIRKACGPDFLIVTPGVRPAGTETNDQKRIMTPGEAIRAGADYLVIGRPITKPATGTRAEAAKRIHDEVAAALS